MQFSAAQIDTHGLDQFVMSSLWAWQTFSAQDAAILGLEVVRRISFAFHEQHGPTTALCVFPDWEMVLGLVKTFTVSLLNLELYKGIPCYKTNTQS